MNTDTLRTLTTQAEYAKTLRPFLPPETFLPDNSKTWLVIINLVILILGWGIVSYLDQWLWFCFVLYLPFAIVMGNSIVVLLFATHDLLHSCTLKNRHLRQLLSLLALTLLWTPPTFWKAVHNREHHNKTNSIADPDRNYLYDHPRNWGTWIQNLFVPSDSVHPVTLIIGMGHSWGVHTFRNLSSVLLFNNGLTKYPVVSFQVSSSERRAIALELLCIASLHLAILAYLEFHPLKLLLSYFLPIWIGHSTIMFYVYTNHMSCPMTTINDPLVNSVSIRVPRFMDLLHLNFSYHTEHHIFPGLNSDYYPMIQELLQKHYPERFKVLGAKQAWQFLLQTPRFYRDEKTFTDYKGERSIQL